MANPTRHLNAVPTVPLADLSNDFKVVGVDGRSNPAPTAVSDLDDIADYVENRLPTPTTNDLTNIRRQTIWNDVSWTSVEASLSGKRWFYAVSADPASYNVGERIKFLQGTAVKYAVVIAINTSNGRVYMLVSTTTSLTNTAPSDVQRTYAKIPPGSGITYLRGEHWTIRVTDNTNRDISPSTHVERVPGALTIDVPPGQWQMKFRCSVLTEAHYSRDFFIPQWRIGYSTETGSYSTRTMTQGQVASVAGKLTDAHDPLGLGHSLTYDAGRERHVYVSGHSHQKWYLVIRFGNITDEGPQHISLLNNTKLSNATETSWVEVRCLYV